MNWKKILKYSFLVLFCLLIVIIILANRDLKKIYGGLTKVVPHEQFDIPATPVIIKNVNLLAEDGETFIANQSIQIVDGHIVKIDSTIKAQDDIKVIDGSGKYLIPGLVDAHIHLFKSQNDLLLYLANGVTQIRELIGTEEHLGWKKEIEEGRLGPEMYVTSPRLGSFGTLEGYFMEWSQWFKNVKDEQDAKKYVKYFKKKGFDGVKVYSHLSKESYHAICQHAEKEGMDVVGHIPWSVGLDEVWSSSQSEVSHLEEIMNALRRDFGRVEGQEGAKQFLDFIDEQSQEMIPDLLENEITITTTLWLTESFAQQKFALDSLLHAVALEYENPGISEWTKNIPQGGLGWLPEVNRYQLDQNLSEEALEGQRIFWDAYADACQVILKNLAAGGVKIMAGTDANLPLTVPGFSLHDELQSMQKAGMTNAQVLRSATAISGEWLGSNSGKIKVGYQADLVLLDENPLEDINHTRKINTVIVDGKVLDRSLLDEMLSAVKAANDQSRKIEITNFQ